jgi:cytochrome c biogenesis protein CcmG/thiol:disulfide interchange protein DsbE
MRRLVYILPALGFLVIAGFLYRSLFVRPSTEFLPSTLIDKPAPRLALPALDAETVGFGPEQLAAGHVSVVNVFGSWCAECVIEAPALMKLAAMAPGGGFELYGMDTHDTPEKARLFLTQRGNPFSRIGIDQDGKVGIEWGVYGAPETFVVDGKGIIRYKFVGALTDKDLAQALLPAIKAAQGP